MNKQGFGQQLAQGDFALLVKGKQEGFVAAYQLYADHVYSLSYHLVCDEQLAKDILQNVFEILLKKANTLNQQECVGAWLKKTTINACMAYFRKAQSEQAYFMRIKRENEQQLQDASEVAQSEHEVMELINQLPATQRSIVYLHTVQNLKHREVAENLSVNEASSRQSYRRALNKLRLWLQQGKSD